MTKRTKSGGAAATEGLLYQAEVCVWTALDLLLVRKTAVAIDVEPLTHEDIEALIEPAIDGATVETGMLEGYRLIVQVKHRSTGPWSAADLNRVLDNGEKRESPRSRLVRDQGARYLLVTDADVSGAAARKLLVEAVGDWPVSDALTPSWREFAGPGDARLAVLGSATARVIKWKVTDLLRDFFRVPGNRVDACLKDLRDEALIRSRAGADSTWSREDLAAVLKRHEARWTATSGLDDFIPPDKWPNIAQQSEAGAVLIAGASGTGKTVAAKVLCDHIRSTAAAAPAFVAATTPAQFEAALEQRPVLIYVEDPWGKFDPSPDAVNWNRTLTAAFPRAGDDLHLVVTSRRDVLAAAGDIGKILTPWTVSLEAEDYSDAQRIRLFETRLTRLDGPTRLVAATWRGDALALLETPLEIERYFIALETARQEGDTDHDLHRKALENAHHKRFETAIADEIVARGDVARAAVVWALLKGFSSPRDADFGRMRRDLVHRGQTFATGLSGLLAFLVTGRSLRLADAGYSYAHPRVEAGLAKAMDRERDAAEDALVAVIDALVARNGVGDRLAAGRLVAAIRRENVARDRDDRFGMPEAPAHDLIDAALESCVEADSPMRFSDAFALIAEAGSSRSRLGQVAAWLKEIAHRDGWMIPFWANADRTHAWFEWARQDSRLEPFLNGFITDVLMRDRLEYGDGLPQRLGDFGFDLGPAFRAALRKMLDYGFDDRASVIIRGVLDDFDETLLIAAEAAAICNAPTVPRSRETYLDQVNGVYDDEYANYLESGPEDDSGWVAGELLDSVVERLHREQGWRAVQSAGFGQAAIWPWHKAASRGTDIDVEEILALFALACGTHAEPHLVRQMARDWSNEFRVPIAQRLRDGQPSRDLWTAVVETLADHATDTLIQLQAEWLVSGREAWALRLQATLSDSESPNQALRKALIDGMPSSVAELARALESAGEAVSPEARQLLTGIEPDELHLAATLTSLGSAVGVPTPKATRVCLDAWEPFNRAPTLTAMRNAIGMADWTTVEAGLDHPLADAKILAMEAWADRSAMHETEVLSRLEGEKSSIIQRWFAHRLARAPSIAHLSALLTLAATEWSSYSRNDDEPGHFPIARTAAEAVATLRNLDAEAVTAIGRVAIRSHDGVVRSTLFGAIVAGGGDRGRSRVAAFSLDRDRPMALRQSAIQGLIEAADALDPETLLEPAVEQAADGRLGLSADWALLLSSLAPPEDIVRIGARIAARLERRILILLLGVDRKKGEREALARLLPDEHPARVLLETDAEMPLPRSAVDDLGDIRLVERVRNLLGTAFEPTPPGPLPRRRR